MSDRPANRIEGNVPKGIDPVDYNVSWEWISVIEALGWTVSVAEMRFDQAAIPFPGFEQQISEELMEKDLGHLDSMRQGDPFLLFYYLHTAKLTEGLRFIKERFNQLGVLKLCKIGTADSAAEVWRTWYPAWTQS